MGRTIIQPIGPLYGEAVNGTVFGRPNGSVYVPDSNSITLTLTEEYVKNATIDGNVIFMLCSSTGTPAASGIDVVAKSQDSQAYIRIFVAADADFTTILCRRTMPAGQFNVVSNNSLGAQLTETGVTAGTTYYCRAVLYSASGVAVATSTTTELTGYEE